MPPITRRRAVALRLLRWETLRLPNEVLDMIVSHITSDCLLESFLCATTCGFSQYPFADPPIRGTTSTLLIDFDRHQEFLVKAMYLATKFIPILRLSQVCRRYRDVTTRLLVRLCPHEFKSRRTYLEGDHLLLRKFITLQRINNLMRSPAIIGGMGPGREILLALPSTHPELYQMPMFQLYFFQARVRLYIFRSSWATLPQGSQDTERLVFTPREEPVPCLDAWHKSFFHHSLRATVGALREAHIVSLVKELTEIISGALLAIQNIFEVTDINQWLTSLRDDVTRFNEKFSHSKTEMQDVVKEWNIPSSMLTEPLYLMSPCVEQIIQGLEIRAEGIRGIRSILENYMSMSLKLGDEEKGTDDPIADLVQLYKDLAEAFGQVTVNGIPLMPAP